METRVLCVDNKPVNADPGAPHLIEGDVYHPTESNVEINGMLFYKLAEFPAWYFAMRLFVPLGDEEITQEEIEEEMYELVEK